MIEIARIRVMARMIASPVIVRREGHNADGSADPIVRNTTAEERPVAAVMLDHEETNEQARRGHCQQQNDPMAAGNDNQHQSPDDKERYRCDHQLENAARVIGLAVAGKQLCQRAGFRWALNHVSTAFGDVRSSLSTGGPLATAPRPRWRFIKLAQEQAKSCQRREHFSVA